MFAVPKICVIKSLDHESGFVSGWTCSVRDIVWENECSCCRCSVSLGCSWVQVQNLLFFRHQRRHLMSNDCPKTKRTMAKLLGVFLHYTPNSDRDMVKNRFPFKDKCSFIWTYFKTEISLKLDSWVYFRREGFSFYSKWNILIQFLRSLDFCKIKL